MVPSEMISLACSVEGAKFTHEELRKVAVKWLTNKNHCSVVLSEIVTIATSEIPDALGFKHNTSILVECKASRSDFRVNASKSHVLTKVEVGEFRYFLTPRGLVSPEEVPDGYGLLEACRPSDVYVKKKAPLVGSNLRAERDMLASALRRVRQREFLVIVPESEIEKAGGLG